MAVCSMAYCYIFTVIILLLVPNNVYCGNGLDLGNLAEIFSTLAGGDGCKFKCPEGIPNKNFLQKCITFIFVVLSLREVSPI